MLSLFVRRHSGARSEAAAVAGVLTLCVVLAGCTAPVDRKPSDSDPSKTAPLTTEWQPPADPSLEGPSEAPPLAQVEGNLEDSITLPTEMTVTLDAIETTTITPETPGEVAGNAVIVSVTVKNTSEDAQNVDSAVVMLLTDDNELGIGTTAGPNVPLAGNVAPGAAASGSYVFMLDPAQGRGITVSVNYAAGQPVALFTGKVP